MGGKRRPFLFIKNKIGSSQQPSPAIPPAEIPRWRKLIIWARGSLLLRAVAGAAPILWAVWVYSPPWTLSLPSSSYRPRNPFQAVFTITNSDLFPGSDVKVTCTENMIRYVVPKMASTSTGREVPSLGTMHRNESRTFACPQFWLYIQTWNRVLSPDEIKRMYLAGPPQEDMSFEWADFEIHVSYSLLGINRIDKYRVVGSPGENGTFIWQQVALDKKF